MFSKVIKFPQSNLVAVAGIQTLNYQVEQFFKVCRWKRTCGGKYTFNIVQMKLKVIALNFSLRDSVKVEKVTLLIS